MTVSFRDIHFFISDTFHLDILNIYMLLLHVIVLENVGLHFPPAVFMLCSCCVPLCVLFLGCAFARVWEVCCNTLS
jgi:hypothetical protein